MYIHRNSSFEFLNQPLWLVKKSKPIPYLRWLFHCALHLTKNQSFPSPAQSKLHKCVQPPKFPLRDTTDMPNPSNTCPTLSLDKRTTKQLKLLPTLTETANGPPGHTACVCNRSCTDSLCQGRKTCKTFSSCEQLRCFPAQLTAPLLQACLREDRPECSRQTLCNLLLHLWVALLSKHLLQQPQNPTQPLQRQQYLIQRSTFYLFCNSLYSQG